MSRMLVWKCRCMSNEKWHSGGSWLMSGSWKVHMGLVHSVYPYGLHREFYEVIDNDVEDIFSDENTRFVKIRNSHMLHRL